MHNIIFLNTINFNLTICVYYQVFLLIMLHIILIRFKLILMMHNKKGGKKMNKKILVFTFFVFVMLIITPYTSSISISEKEQNFILKSKEYVNLINENMTMYYFATFGISDSTISEITYQKGSFIENSSFFFNVIMTITARLIFICFL